MKALRLFAGTLALACACGLSLTTQATTITLDEINHLVITDETGSSVASLPTGSISEKITADNQVFKLSFGKDLENNHTIIIYPDPSAPQSLAFNLLGADVTMTADSVLTVSAPQSGAAPQLQAGVLGEITLAGSPIAPGLSVHLQNGQAVAAVEPEPLAEDITTTSTEEVPASTNQAAERLISEFSQGLVVKEVTGTVMMAPQGTDVMDLLRQSTSLPTLKPGDIIPNGASIRTDFGGSMVVAQSPGVTFQVLENTNMQIEENSYEIQNGVEKRAFKANLNKGGIINSLGGLDPNNTKYEIQTPLAVAAARGTAFSVFTSDSISVIITGEGDVEVITRGGTYRTTEGQKTVVTFGDGTGEERTAQFDATSEEVQIIQNLIQAAQRVNARRELSGGGGRPITDDRGLTPADGSGGGATSDDQLFLDRADPDQVMLNNAVDDFIGTFQPRLNPGAITPVQSGQ